MLSFKVVWAFESKGVASIPESAMIVVNERCPDLTIPVDGC
jgi:hypothetical protein